MQHSSTSTRARPGVFAGVFGLRLFYRPAFRLRLATFAVALAALAYAVRAVVQMFAFESESPTWDFLQFYRAAVELGTGNNPYASFLSACPGDHWCQGGYIFPPLLAEVLRPFTLLAEPAAARVWLGLSHVLLVVTAVVMWRALRGLLTPAAGLFVVAAGLLFLPLY